MRNRAAFASAIEEPIGSKGVAPLSGERERLMLFGKVSTKKTVLEDARVIISKQERTELGALAGVGKESPLRASLAYTRYPALCLSALSRLQGCSAAPAFQ